MINNLFQAWFSTCNKKLLKFIFCRCPNWAIYTDLFTLNGSFTECHFLNTSKTVLNVTTRYTEVQFENAKIWFGNVGWWFQNAKEQFWATESKWSESKNVNHNLRIQNSPSHSVKRVRIWSYSSQYFPAFGLNTERYGISLRNISLDSVRMQENTNQNNSEYGHFSFGDWRAKSIVLMKCKIFYLNTKIKDRMRHDVNFNTQKSWFQVPKLVSNFPAKMQFQNINIQFWNTV